jgi:hypothetical protein
MIVFPLGLSHFLQLDGHSFEFLPPQKDNSTAGEILAWNNLRACGMLDDGLFLHGNADVSSISFCLAFIVVCLGADPSFLEQCHGPITANFISFETYIHRKDIVECSYA